MNLSIFQAVIMGLTQGLAEFLPISSSGHLLLVQKLLGIPSTLSPLFYLLTPRNSLEP